MYHVCLNFVSKYAPELEYAPDQFLWRYFNRNLMDYKKLVLLFGATPPLDKIIGEQIKSYDDQVDYFEYTTYSEAGLEPIRLNSLGNLTEPYITSEYWTAFISLYTNYTYTAFDYIYYRAFALQILMKIYKHMGEAKLRYLIAWKFFSHLVRFTEPYFFLNDRPANEACYQHVRSVMSLAVISPYFESMIPEDMVEEAKQMVHEIRFSYAKAFLTSTWLSSDFREAAVNKTASMVFYVGSPGRRLDPEFVEAFYIHVDGPEERVFMMKLVPSPFYTGAINDMTIPTASMLPPFMYPYGVKALNYGGLGTLSLSGEEKTLSDELDSENLADFVGTKMAYDAFNSLELGHRHQTLAGMNMSAQQLFFFNPLRKMVH
ncbi:hypothetical protein MRX96_036606 [Rhipicephalus microplus]